MNNLLSRLLLSGLLLTGTSALRAEEAANKKCPIMTDEAVESDHNVTLGGVSIAMCCGKCEKIWNKSETSQKYYAKVALEMGLLPQLKGKEKELGLDKIELLPQRFCPLHPTMLVTPESPTVEYKGVKVYLFDAKSVAAWNKDPEANAKKAIEAKLLPQLAGK